MVTAYILPNVILISSLPFHSTKFKSLLSIIALHFVTGVGFQSIFTYIHFLITDLLRCNMSSTQFTLLVYSQGCTTVTTVNFRIFSSSQKKPCIHQLSLLFLPLQPWATTNPLSVSVDLPVPRSGIMPYVDLTDWLLSLSIFLRFHVACISTLFRFMAE